MARAELLSGRDRWALLIEFAEAFPSDAPQRKTQLARVVEEINTNAHVAVAGELASMTSDSEIRDRLQLRQAELTTRPKEKADLCWELIQRGAMPQANLAWACKQLNAGNRSANVIALLEAEIRRRGRLPRKEIVQLGNAYAEEERGIDFERCLIQDVVPKPPAPPTPQFRGGFF